MPIARNSVILPGETWVPKWKLRAVGKKWEEETDAGTAWPHDGCPLHPWMAEHTDREYTVHELFVFFHDKINTEIKGKHLEIYRAI